MIKHILRNNKFNLINKIISIIIIKLIIIIIINIKRYYYKIKIIK